MNRNEAGSTGDGRSCICLECNTRVPHRSWITCLEMNCPMCGSIMVMEGSPYHRYVLQHGTAADAMPRSRRRTWRWRHREVRESYV